MKGLVDESLVRSEKIGTVNLVIPLKVLAGINAESTSRVAVLELPLSGRGVRRVRPQESGDRAH